MNAKYLSRFTLFLAFAVGASLESLTAYQSYNDYYQPNGFAKTMRRSFIDQQNQQELDANIQGQVDLQAINDTMAQDRAKFWELYPDKPGYDEARLKFLHDLYCKDMFYINQPENARTAGRLGDQAVDGGIPLGAIVEFDRWGEAIHGELYPNNRNFFDSLDQLLQSPGAISRAIKDNQKFYDAYVIQRDWCEFDAAHRNPAGSEDPNFYGTIICQRWEWRTPDDALRQYNEMKHAIGSDAFFPAIIALRDAPKKEDGTIADWAKLGLFTVGFRGTNDLAPAGLFPVDYNLMSALVTLATKGDPRLYMIGQLAKESPDLVDENYKNRTPYGQLSHYQFDFKYGEQAYNEWIAALGPEAVQKVCVAALSAQRGIDGDLFFGQDAKPAWNTTTGCLSILIKDDPKKYVRARIALDLHLTTSAAVDDTYNKLIATYGEPAVLAAVPKTQKLRTLPSGCDTEYAALLCFLDNKVKLDANGQVDKTVEDPRYASWKTFPLGSRLTFYRGRWQVMNYSQDLLKMGINPLQMTYPYYSRTDVLETLVPERLVLGEATLQYVDKSNWGQYPDRTEISARTSPLDQHKTLREGDEMIPINGQNVRCHWTTIPAGRKDDGSSGTSTVWKSDRIPGGIARSYDFYYNYDDRGQKMCDETVIVSCDLAPATPDTGAPLTPSGLLDVVPPFPNGVSPPPPAPPNVNPPKPKATTLVNPQIGTPSAQGNPATSGRVAWSVSHATPLSPGAQTANVNQTIANPTPLYKLTGKTTGSPDLDARIMRDFDAPGNDSIPKQLRVAARQQIWFIVHAQGQFTPLQVKQLDQLCSILEKGQH